MSDDVLDHVLGLKKARRDLLRGLHKSALEHCEVTQKGETDSKSDLSDDDIRKVRSVAVVFIAEFFFILKKLDLMRDPVLLEAYLLDHNKGLSEKIHRLKTGDASTTPSGLQITRLEDGMLAPEKISEIVSDAKVGFLRFDQSTLGALLIELMVKQSTNTHLAVLERCGFLVISGRKPKFISSTGKLEELYESYLGQVKSVFKTKDT